MCRAASTISVAGRSSCSRSSCSSYHSARCRCWSAEEVLRARSIGDDSPLFPHAKVVAPFLRCLESRQITAHLNSSEMVRVFLAVTKLPDIPTTEGFSGLVEVLTGNELDAKMAVNAAQWILDCPSRNAVINDAADYLNLTFRTMIPFLVLECFNEKELAAILGSPDKPLADALAAAPRPRDSTERDLQRAEMRRRLLRIGLRRYEHWMLLMHDAKGSPSQLFTNYLEHWVLIAERMAVDSIFKAHATTVVSVPLLGDTCDIGTGPNGIQNRKTGVDDEIGLVVRLIPKKDGQPLVLSGESGSGKTYSALALAKEKNWMTVYVRAQTLFDKATNDKSLPKETLEKMRLLQYTSELSATFPLSTDDRNKAAAAALVSMLVNLQPKFKHAMQHDSDPARPLAFVVDEAGQYPHLVRAMCSSSFKLLAPSRDGTALSDHLKLPGGIQLVVVGTGVGAENGKCGSCPENYEHIVLETTNGYDRVIARLEQHMCSKPGGMATLYRTFCQRHKSDGSAACQVFRRIEALKSNPRMFACFVNEVMKSKRFPLSGEDSSLKLRLSRQFTIDAAAYAEFSACTHRAMMEFQDRNGLNGMSFDEVQAIILVSLAYSCLAWYCKVTPPLIYLASYGVLVDHIKRVKTVAGGDRLLFEVVGECVKKPPLGRKPQASKETLPGADGVKFVIPARMNHRYDVSPALLQMGLSTLGIREPVWTRLGFERIMSDALYLITCMSVQSGFPVRTSHGDETPTDDLVLFNNLTIDPLCNVKRNIWRYAQEIASSEARDGVVLVVTTTLKAPPADDAMMKLPVNWPRVAVGKKRHPVIPATWLLQELSCEVKKQLDPFMASSGVKEVRVIVHAMMYRDAPGIDGVISYGTYSASGDRPGAGRRGGGRRGGGGSQLPYKVSRLVKLQMKCCDRASGGAENDKHAILTRMGKYLPNKDNGLPPDVACVVDGSELPATESGDRLTIEHLLLQYGEHETVLYSPNHVRLNPSTIAEALHPTQWFPADVTLDEHSEVRTRCVAISPGRVVAVKQKP